MVGVGRSTTAALLAWVIVLLLLFPLKDNRPESARDAYSHALKLFQRGRLVESQTEAEEGYREFRSSDPRWALNFELLEAEAMLWRGMYDEALRILATCHPDPDDLERLISKSAIESVALIRQQRVPAAEKELSDAAGLCGTQAFSACGEVLRAQAILALKLGKTAEARQFFIDALGFARSHHDRWLEANASLNLGAFALRVGRFDEAIDWSRTAYRMGVELGAEATMQGASGNLGWAYYQLGDNERALDEFLHAEKSAEILGQIRSELAWITAAGYVYRDNGDLTRATQSYHRAFELATQIGSEEDVVNALEDLAQVSVDAGKVDEASGYLNRVTPMETAGGGHVSANVQLAEGMVAAARRQDGRAEWLLNDVRNNAANATTIRLGAGEQLARLYEAEGRKAAAEQMYKATLSQFDSAQAELKSEESQLPFVANAARIYDDYIHLLLEQGRNEEALAVADESRARTLAESLGQNSAKGSGQGTAALNPRLVAEKSGAMLLFYWLGEKQTCLWAITPQTIRFFPLPARAEIAARVERYRKAVLDFEDPVQKSDQDGQALYQMLVAPAAKLIRSDRPVMILADGALNQLNFETLLAPGASPLAGTRSTNLHYWIDDVTLLSAPSLAMLAGAKPVAGGARNMLLLGNPASPSDEFPSLPLFGFEMTRIGRHFARPELTIFSSGQATPAAYLASGPGRYSYIHFVSHAVSSRTDPLDSAIILSRSSDSPDSFKLYAREIMRHPIDARLVTISACYGSGTRSYTGEGLVGLSWAFLRAGAHQVIGALWEVSDDSTPRLMDSLYQGVEAGKTPATALRAGKLALVHSGDRFGQPFYWAPFQIYSSR
jgi:CHAT domain-containing protein/tetratricopeptide (TPR) repeat protein